jgi:hypothetical protein
MTRNSRSSSGPRCPRAQPIRSRSVSAWPSPARLRPTASKIEAGEAA